MSEKKSNWLSHLFKGWRPQSEAIKEMDDPLRVLTALVKQSGAPEAVEIARQASVAGNTAGQKADAIVLSHERLAAHKLPFSSEVARTELVLEHRLLPRLSYTKLAEVVGERFNITGRGLRERLKGWSTH